MRHVWMTDCKSLEEHLTAAAMGKVEDKRLSIDLNSLRQDLWTNGEEEVEMLHPTRFCDKVLWFDTSAMLVDSLTKVMPVDVMMGVLNTGYYDTTADPESTAKNAKTQLARSKL